MMNQSEQKRLKRLKNKFYFSCGIILILVGVLFYATAEKWRPFLEDRDSLYEGMRIEKDAPHAAEVAAVIKDLRYSGLRDFVNPKVLIAFDFEQKQYTLKNIHRYDERGETLLAEGKYGVCGDLAMYTYQKLRPIFEKKYHIQFMKVAESGYFSMKRGGAHIMLRVINKDLAPTNPKKIFLLDPSYKRYGGPDLFDEYYPLEEFQYESFLKEPLHETYDVNSGPPIVINKKAMLLFAVKDVNGKFDRDNFSLSLSLMRRYGYLNHPLYRISRKNGKVSESEDLERIQAMITDKTYQRAKKALKTLFDKTVQGLPLTDTVSNSSPNALSVGPLVEPK